MDINQEELYDDVVFENNRIIEPPPQMLSLTKEIFDMIQSRLDFMTKDRNKYFDCLAYKLSNLYGAYRSGCSLVYPRDSTIYVKRNCPEENRHFWNRSIITDICDALKDAMYIKQVIGNNLLGYRTIAIIRPFLYEKFRDIRPYKIKLSDKLDPIELRRRDKKKQADWRVKYKQIPISYKDSQDPCIPDMRNELRSIYRYYKNQDLAGFIPSTVISANPKYLIILNQCNNTGKIESMQRQDGVYFRMSDRWVKRIFNNSTFINGGRIYAFWQTLPRELRKYLLINGSNVAELDYSGCQIRMLYHMWLKEPCRDKDVYELIDISRPIAKKAAVICINAETQQEALGALRAYCIDELNMTDVSYDKTKQMMQAFMTKHRPISECFNSGAGVILMRLESEVIVRIIRELMSLNICVLTIHDSCIFPAQHQKLVYEAMMEEYKSVLKFYPTVKLEK
jgi:hypothetical protein